MELETYFKVIRVLAGLSAVTIGLLEAWYNPGILDVFNGMSTGLIIYALWRA